MAKRTKAETARRAEWWARPAWPVAILGIDPGSKSAGASLVIPSKRRDLGEHNPMPTLKPHLAWSRTIDPFAGDYLEQTVGDAMNEAFNRSFHLILLLEDWGKGGPLGIDQWLGLGAARGFWRRAAWLRAPSSSGVMVRSRLFAYANISRWRSAMDVVRTPAEIEDGPDGWKRAAARRLVELAPYASVDSADASESALIALYGSRCDEVGRMLPISLLREHGRTRPGEETSTKVAAPKTRRRSTSTRVDASPAFGEDPAP